MKKVIAIVLSFILCLSICSAAEISAGEQEIIDALKETHSTADGHEVTIPVKYTNMVENEFDVLDVTEEQKTFILGKIEEAWTLIEAANYMSKADFGKSDLAKKLVELIQECADLFEYTITFNSTNVNFKITRPDGTVVGEDGQIIKQTGFDSSNMMIVGGICVTLFLGSVCFAAVRKNRA